MRARRGTRGALLCPHMSRLAFPPQMTVLVRDWLSANQVLLEGRDGAVLIDAGYARHAPLTLALVDTARGARKAVPLVTLVNTHCHSDHMGGNAAIARRFGCRIEIPIGEAPAVAAWDQRALLLDYADQRADRFTPDATLAPGDVRVWGDLEWQCVAAPGHDMGALMFFNPEHGILVSGDALWQYGFGFVMPPELDPAALPATRATLDVIARLPVRVVVPGHGDPFTDVEAALERAYRRVDSFVGHSQRMARHALKVLFAFALLDRQRMALADVPGYVERVGMFREFNAQYFRQSGAVLARGMLRELEVAGAIRCEHGEVRPAVAS